MATVSCRDDGDGDGGSGNETRSRSRLFVLANLHTLTRARVRSTRLDQLHMRSRARTRQQVEWIKVTDERASAQSPHLAMRTSTRARTCASEEQQQKNKTKKKNTKRALSPSPCSPSRPIVKLSKLARAQIMQS